METPTYIKNKRINAFNQPYADIHMRFSFRKMKIFRPQKAKIQKKKKRKIENSQNSHFLPPRDPICATK